MITLQYIKKFLYLWYQVQLFIKAWKFQKDYNNYKKIIKKKQIIAENFCAFLDLLWCKSLEYIGKNEEVIAPSAVILLNKFGNLDEIKKISDTIPAPKKKANTISRIKPVILLKIVNKALILNPLIKKIFI